MYFANTWHKSFNFVITPEEFEAVFSRDDYEFVISNMLVDIDYISTEKYPMYAIFKDIIKQIKKISHKAKMMKGEQLLKPDFWISDKAQEQVGRNYYLQQMGLVFV